MDKYARAVFCQLREIEFRAVSIFKTPDELEQLARRLRLMTKEIKRQSVILREWQESCRGGDAA